MASKDTISLPRLFLAIFSHMIESSPYAGPVIAQQFVNIFQTDLKLEDALQATDTSIKVSRAFKDADTYFKTNAPEALSQLIDSLPFQGIESLMSLAKDLPKQLDDKAFVTAIQKEFTTSWGKVLPQESIGECVRIYMIGMNRALSKHLSMDIALMEIFKLREELEYQNLQQEREVTELKSLLTTRRQATKRWLTSRLPEKSYPKLVGREKVVERLYEEIIMKTHRLTVIYGPIGIGKSSIVREVAEKLSDSSEELQMSHQNSEGGVIIWHSVSPYSSDAEKVCEDLKYDISRALGIKEYHISDLWDELENKFVLLIVNGLRGKVTSNIMNYLRNDTPQNVQIMITCQEELAWADYHSNPHEMRIEGISSEYIHDFFQLYGLDKKFSKDEILEIEMQTHNNPKLLRKFTGYILQGFSFKEALVFAVSGTQETLDRLETKVAAIPLLKACTLFNIPVHEKALSKIAGVSLSKQQLELTLDELRKNFCLHKEKNIPHRYSIDSQHLQYMKKVMEDNNEYDEFRARWIDYYCELRRGDKKTDNDNDETGWTIMSDYQPDVNEETLKYADEALTVLDAINYCLSDDRVASHWTKAAQLLDDFRATIFASGKWDDRLDYCQKIIKYASQENQFAILGKFYRLSAWMRCFRDEYYLGRDLAYEALSVTNKALRGANLAEKDQYAHLQTQYKAYNTLGQIALRYARQLALQGQRLQRHTKQSTRDNKAGNMIPNDDESIEYFGQAIDAFRDAELKFLQAMLLVEQSFKPEALVMEYHMAEVAYYNRHLISTVKPEEKRIYAREHLTRVRRMFERILKEAHEPSKGFWAKRPHERLIANTQYYLGKTLRRLGILCSDDDNPDILFNQSEQYLSNALQTANIFYDRVLVAKVKFAQCQWYESQARRPNNAAYASTYFSKAQQLAFDAFDAFRTTNMKLEREDTEAFSKSRLSLDIEPNKMMSIKKLGSSFE